MRRIAVLAAIAALGLAACGSDKSSSSTSTPAAASGGAASTLKIAADPGGAKKFTTSTLTATAGKVTVDFSNQAQIPHAVVIEGNGVNARTAVVSGSDAAPVSVDLKAGTYTFYCPVGDHRAEGMEGTLTVK